MATFKTGATRRGGSGNDNFLFQGAAEFAQSGHSYVGGAGFDVLRFDAAVTLTDGMFAGVQEMEGLRLGGAGQTRLVLGSQAASAFTDGVIRVSAANAGSVMIDASALGAATRLVMSSGSAGDDVVLGGAGNDILVSGGGIDLLSGGGGDDIISFADGAQFARAGQVIAGGAGQDQLRIAGDVAVGDDAFAGVSGIETLVLLGSGAQQITLADNAAAAFTGGILRVTATKSASLVVDGEDLGAGTALRAVGGAGADTLDGGAGGDTLTGQGGNDKLCGADGDDALRGDDGSDTLDGGFGRDGVNGGAGDDLIVSASDTGEPVIAQSPGTPRVHADENLSGNDMLTGGAGADTFRFVLMLDAKAEIAARHVDADGHIDWQGVAGENGDLHDHWVNGIGRDVMSDFRRAEGDRIEILGHTVKAKVTQADSDGDGVNDYSVIRLTSNQGANGGAHNGDVLGQIVVRGDLITAADITVDAGVHYGEYETLADLQAGNHVCCTTESDHALMG